MEGKDQVGTAGRRTRLLRTKSRIGSGRAIAQHCVAKQGVSINRRVYAYGRRHRVQ